MFQSLTQRPTRSNKNKWKVVAFDWLRNGNRRFSWVIHVSLTREAQIKLSFPAFQAGNTFFDKSRVFQEYGGINEDWVNEWVSHRGITAGWPSALLWHKQKRHVPPLCWGNAPTRLHRASYLAPCRWSLVLFFGICLFRDHFLIAATCYGDHVTEWRWLIRHNRYVVAWGTGSLWQIGWMPDINRTCSALQYVHSLSVKLDSVSDFG